MELAPHIEAITDDGARARMPFSAHAARRDGIVSGQAMMAFANTVTVTALCASG